MKIFLLLPFLIASLNALGPREDIQQAYRAQKWEELEKLATDYFENFGTRDLQNPRDFGPLYFKLGVALWHQGHWEKASQAFKISYAKSRKRLDNPDRLTALWGFSDCAYRLGNHGHSIRLAKKYLMEQDNRERRKYSPFARGPKCLGHDPFFK